jgi:hypothetical protein
VTITLVALAFALGMGSGVAVTKVKRRAPVNVVRGILLPHPTDERWHLTDKRYNCGDRDHHYHAVYELEAVRVVEDCGVDVESVPVPGARRYRDAVIRAQLERKALAAALGES